MMDNPPKIRKPKAAVLIVAVVLLLLVISVAAISFSKNSVNIQFTDASLQDQTHRVASFDIAIDGVSTNMVSFKAYATTKLSDIEKTGEEYKPHSFLKAAYQTHEISVTNNSETSARCILSTSRTMDDDRIFYVILPVGNSTENVLKALYTDTNINTPQKVRDYLEGITFKQSDLAIGEAKTFTMVVWSEHDAVYPDSDGDGIADEEGVKLAELTDGVPFEEFTLDFIFEQVD